jgi:deoxycytidine triphosphate deaminase
MGAPFGILPGQMIRELYREKCIISEKREEKPVIGSSEMDLTISRNEKETVVKNGETPELVYLGQRIVEKFPGLGQVYVIGQGRSSSAKAGADIMIVNPQGKNLEPGYRGALCAKVSAAGGHPNGFGPGDRIADLMFCSGHPDECILDPQDVLADVSNLVKEKYVEIDGKKVILRLGLTNGNGPVGYKAKVTDQIAWLRRDANKRGDFFEPIYSCPDYDAKKGDFLLLQTPEFTVDPKAEVPFIARMLPYNKNRMRVNLKDTIRYGTKHQKIVMEIPVEHDVKLRHRDPICEIMFYRMYARPDARYSDSGARNNRTITGTFFYA